MAETNKRKPKKIRRRLTGGAPEIYIDWDEVNALAEAGSSGLQIASYLGINPKTLYARCIKEHGTPWADYCRRKDEKGKAALLLSMHKKALHGNAMMLIWMGKQRLNHFERTAIHTTANKEVTIDVRRFTDEELKFIGECNDDKQINDLLARKGMLALTDESNKESEIIEATYVDITTESGD